MTREAPWSSAVIAVVGVAVAVTALATHVSAAVASVAGTAFIAVACLGPRVGPSAKEKEMTDFHGGVSGPDLDDVRTTQNTAFFDDCEEYARRYSAPLVNWLCRCRSVTKEEAEEITQMFWVRQFNPDRRSVLECWDKRGGRELRPLLRVALLNLHRNWEDARRARLERVALLGDRPAVHAGHASQPSPDGDREADNDHDDRAEIGDDLPAPEHDSHLRELFQTMRDALNEVRDAASEELDADGRAYLPRRWPMTGPPASEEQIRRDLGWSRRRVDRTGEAVEVALAFAFRERVRATMGERFDDDEDGVLVDQAVERWHRVLRFEANEVDEAEPEQDEAAEDEDEASVGGSSVPEGGQP